jgi:hypothetical protein
MLPVLAGRVLTAAADRVVDQVDQLAGRLGDIAEHGLPERTRSAGNGDDPARRPVGGAFAFVVEQVRRLLDILVQLLARAAMTVRTATERLRQRRAPEGIDEAEDHLDAEHDDLDGERAAV